MMGASLLYCGWQCNQTWPYYTSLAIVLCHISNQIYTLDIHDREDCAKKFVSNRWVGLILFLGCVGGTYLKDTEPPSSSSSSHREVPPNHSIPIQTIVTDVAGS